jgi:hypothetical protein
MTQPVLQGTIPLLPPFAPFLELRWSTDLSTVHVSLVQDVTGTPIWETTLTPTNSAIRWKGDQGLLREELDLSVDLSLGELVVKASAGHRLPGMDWSDNKIEEHLYWNPVLGSVAGHGIAYPPVIDSHEFGKSRSVVPNINRIVVDDKPRLGTDVGNKVKTIFFAHEPAFLFNVCFAVGEFTLGGSGLYGDPSSIWFNVFMGYYEIDVPVSRGRPFGYQTESTSSRQIEGSDLTRIAKADWNYFSNYIYGVPEEYIRPHNTLTDQVTFQQTTERIGNKDWDHVVVDGVKVVSGYAPAGRGLLNNSALLSPVWRETFGGAVTKPTEGVPPFVGTTLQAGMYMSFHKEDGRYRTRIFGGTITDRHKNQDFFNAQMGACKNVIVANFSSLGF